MGTWGPGNFDSDTAAEHLTALTERLGDDLARAFAGAPGSIHPDADEGATVPCNVELLALIAEQRWEGLVLPPPATVRRWKVTYLAAWDRSIDELGPRPAWKRQRRLVLTKSFDRLVRASVRHHRA